MSLGYLKGIVSATQRKNGWQLAEHAGETRPDGMQRLLNSAIWDADLVRDDLRAYILSLLRAPLGLLPYLVKLFIIFGLRIHYEAVRTSYARECIAFMCCCVG